VAQHAFRHIEEYLDTTPLKYMFHRWEDGVGSSKFTVIAQKSELTAVPDLR
jgi:hypothetical protein